MVLSQMMLAVAAMEGHGVMVRDLMMVDGPSSRSSDENTLGII